MVRNQRLTHFFLIYSHLTNENNLSNFVFYGHVEENSCKVFPFLTFGHFFVQFSKPKILFNIKLCDFSIYSIMVLFPNLEGKLRQHNFFQNFWRTVFRKFLC